MNLMITNRCNLRCRHCMYSCTLEGKDMSMDIFNKAIERATIIQIFGGEPTLHPNFIQMVDIASKICKVQVTSNGKLLINRRGKTKLLKQLEKLINDKNRHEITLRISTGNYYIEQGCRYYNYYIQSKYPYIQFVDITDDLIYRLGRAVDIKAAKKCECKEDLHNWFYGEPQILVYPNGDVAQCCQGKQIFMNINEDKDVWEEYNKLTVRHSDCELCSKYNKRYKQDII